MKIAEKTVVTLKMIAALLLLIPFSAHSNGVVDVGVVEEDKRINTFIRTKNNYFITFDSFESDRIGVAYGFQYKSGFVLLGADDKDIFLRGFYRHPKTEWGVDVGLIDSIEDTKVRFDLGFSYYIGDNFALIAKTDFDTTFLGFRRWM